jgi:acetylornithine/N-succinyldiaminopimelate aminotransferase
VELEPGLDARVVTSAALSAGVVVNAVTPTALRLAPPLVITDDELDHGVALLGNVLGSTRDACGANVSTGASGSTKGAT